MSIFQEKATVEQLEQLSNENYLLTINSPRIAAVAKPGQFVMLDVAEGRDPLLSRPFSLNRVESTGLIRILFKVVGKGTKLLSRSGRGTRLPILGPLGNGFDIDLQKPACLIGGGMGIAPMLFLADYLSNIERKDKADTIILGGRNSEELQPLIADFTRLGTELLTATDDGSLGTHGLVTDVLSSLQLSTETIIYSCGPKPMLFAVYQNAKEKGICCQVSIESVMACGMGACLGCSVPAAAGGYVHVCSDGPVFNAEDLEWFI